MISYFQFSLRHSEAKPFQSPMLSTQYCKFELNNILWFGHGMSLVIDLNHLVNRAFPIH